MSLDTLEAIRSRRVTRFFSEAAISEEIIWKVVEAARWASTASGRLVFRFICINNPKIIRQIKLVTPGMVGNLPAALIVVCLNWSKAGINPFEKEKSRGNAYIDVGTATASMLLAAHAQGLGAGPITSFSPDAIAELINVPKELRPEMLITLGYPGDLPPSGFKLPKVRIPIQDLVQWGPYPE